MTEVQHSHDLHLPAWGPYIKKYTGISHIPDIKLGLRFDLSVFPGFYRRHVMAPNAKWESGEHPWAAAADLSYFAYRYELEWKAQVYCDVSFSALGDAERVRLVRCEFVNNTDLDQNLVLHYMAYLNFPPVRTYSDEVLRPSRVILPQGAVWLDAADYADLGFATPRPTDSLVPDGWWRGEIRAHGFVGGSGVGRGFGADRGDWAAYTLNLPAPVPDARLVARYRAAHGPAAFALEGIARGELALPAADGLAVQTIPLGDLPAGSHPLRLTSTGLGPVELDGLVVVAAASAGDVRFVPVERNPVPDIQPGPVERSLILKYDDAPVYYGLAWTGDDSVVRQIFAEELDRTLRYTVHEHVQKVRRGAGEGHFTNAFVRPSAVPPHECRVLYGRVCAGSREEVAAQIHGFAATPLSAHEAAAAGGQQSAVTCPATPAGQPYAFSQERMAALIPSANMRRCRCT